MTKEEKIKEIYGSRYIALKESINCNGWINQNVTTRALFDSLEFDEKRNSMRPLGLKGIENNNGWIKIESEDDLPKEYSEYWVVDKDDKMIYKREYNNSNIKFFFDYSTHYQPIEKPKPPIY